VGDGIYDHELDYVTKTGEKIPMSFSCSVVWNEKDELLGVVCVARDIRERKRLVQKEKELVVAEITAEADRKRVAELMEAYKKLEKADQELKDTTAQLVQNEKLTALGEMAAGVAHELNQPLHGIKLICQGLLRNIEKHGYDQNRVAENLQETVGLVDRMAGIIDHMRLFSRHPRGEQGGEVDVNEAVEGVFKLLGQQLYVNNIEVRKELSSNMPKALINQIGLEQVLMNLIINARHALEESGRKPMTIEIKSFLKEKDGLKEAVVSVRDNAGGVPEDIQAKIFEPFFTTKGPGKGTGLGLSVSRKIITDAGGRIELEVDEGIGSTFSVILPIKAFLTTDQGQ
jgi:C4-dicarboxylate-specific signal transduction histidine kinase